MPGGPPSSCAEMRRGMQTGARAAALRKVPPTAVRASSPEGSHAQAQIGATQESRSALRAGSEPSPPGSHPD